MKKNNLIAGVFYLIAGVLFLTLGILTNTKLDSLFFGFAGAGIVPGLLMICKYFHWSKPENIGAYNEKLKNEQIDLHDELKEKLRDKSGRYSYLIGLITVGVSILIFSVLGMLEYINPRIIIIFLGVYMLFQIVLGVVIYNRLLKKYE